jgi:hypothetical protein
LWWLYVFFVIVMIDARVVIDSLMMVGWGQLNCSPELAELAGVN